MGIASDDLTAGWQPARLIPTVGIRGQEEQERRATSSLLAVAQAVPEFGHALFGPLGAPKGRIRTFTVGEADEPEVGSFAGGSTFQLTFESPDRMD